MRPVFSFVGVNTKWYLPLKKHNDSFMEAHVWRVREELNWPMLVAVDWDIWVDVTLENRIACSSACLLGQYVQVMLILSGCLLPEPLGKSSLWWISLQLEVKQSSPCAADWCSKATQTSGINFSIISFLKSSYCFDTDSLVIVCLEMMSIWIGRSKWCFEAPVG